MSLTTYEVDIANQSLGNIGAKQMTFATQTTVEGVQANLHYDQTRNMLLRSFEWTFAKTRLSLVDGWATDTIYTTDQYVWQNSLLYKCAVAHTSDVFLTDIASWSLQSTVDVWATATDYVLNDYVVNDTVYYRCILAHTSGDEDDEPGTGADYATYWSISQTKPVNDFGYNYTLPSDCLRVVNITNQEMELVYRLEGSTILTDDTEIDILYIKEVTDTTLFDPLFTECLISKLALNLIGPLTGSGAGVMDLRTFLSQEFRLLMSQTRTIGKQEGNITGSSDWNNARFSRV